MRDFQIGNYALDSELLINILYAIAILVVTWLLANIVKWTAAKLVDRISLLQKTTGTGESVGTSIGKIASLIIWLFGIVGVLQIFRLENVTAPLLTLLNSIMAFLPNVLGAILFFFVGLIIARIVREIVQTALMTLDLDKWMAKGGVAEVTGTNQLSKTIANVVFALIIILVSIGALGALRVDAISGPAITILQQVAIAIPLVIGAALLLGIFYFIGRYFADLVRELVANLGADRAIASMDVLPKGVTASGVISKIVLIAIVVAGAIAATRMLNFPELTFILEQVLELGGRVVFGSAVIAVGVLLANLIANLVASSTGEKGVVVSMLRYLIIGVATFMGLTFMEIGEQIVILAFGGFVFAVAVASALAFGLGGRDAASRQLSKWQDDADSPAKPARKPAARKPKTPGV